jgi:hypothetical protein
VNGGRTLGLESGKNYTLVLKTTCFARQGAYLFSELRVNLLFIVRAESRARESTERESCLIYFGDLRRGPADPVKFEAVDGAKFEISCHQGNKHAFAREMRRKHRRMR